MTLQLGAALGLAVLASISTIHSNHLIALGRGTPAALTSGYHVAFMIGAGCLAVGIALASILLRPSGPGERAVGEAAPTAVTGD